MNYLAVLESTYLIHVIRPYHGRTAQEITLTPNIYGFDTGFVAWSQGVHEISPKDKGFFWEHLVLNELIARLQSRGIRAFRALHPGAMNLVVASDIVEPYTRTIAGLEIIFTPLNRLAEVIKSGII